MWTQFWDMHSGGGTKESPYEKIYIEAQNEKEAKIVFYNRFGHNPNRVTCTCCGEDYSISSEEDLGQLTGYHRHCEYDNNTQKYTDEPRKNYYENRAVIPLEVYCTNHDVLVIRDEDIKPEEKIGEVPDQGYMWID